MQDPPLAQTFTRPSAFADQGGAVDKIEKEFNSNILSNLGSHTDASSPTKKKHLDADVRHNAAVQKDLGKSIKQPAPKAYSRFDFMHQIFNQGGVLRNKNPHKECKKTGLLAG